MGGFELAVSASKYWDESDQVTTHNMPRKIDSCEKFQIMIPKVLAAGFSKVSRQHTISVSRWAILLDHLI
jgi:hypothetical protein